MAKINNQAQDNPLKQSLSSCLGIIKFILLFGFTVNLLMLSTPLFSMQVLDRVLSSQNMSTLLALTMIIILALFLLGVIQTTRALAMHKMGNWLESTLSEIVFSNVIKLSSEFKGMASSQQLRDLQTIKTFATSPGLISIMDTPWAIIFIIALFILHTWIGSLALLSGLILILFGVVADRSTKSFIEKNNENFIKSMRQIEQSLRNAEVIEVMGMKSSLILFWQKINQEVQESQNVIIKKQAIFMEIIKFFRLLIQISVTALGAYLVTKGQISAGTIIASSSLVGRALAPFESAINSWKGYISFKKSYERLNISFDKYVNDSDKMSLLPPRGIMSAENAFYIFPRSSNHILKNISLSLQQGDSLVIVGASASGKTTLAKLLVGVINPIMGDIKIDGGSLRNWKKEELGPYMGYLPQNVELFSGTISKNIARMHSDPHYEDIVAASKLAGAHKMILKLPQGYNTDIGFEGSSLSGGQKQRVGLARTFYGCPKVIVLDEPNSSLDSEGENALMIAVEIAKASKITTIIVSHKTSIINVVDKILILEEGVVLYCGDKKNIMEKLEQLEFYE